jgi:ribosomal protein S18 acetylase RimI-like enzyme
MGDTYRTIRLQALADAPDAFGSSLEIESKQPLSKFEDRVANGTVFGAFDGETIIGVAGFYKRSGAKENHKGVLWGMYVTPNARNRHVGQLLVQSILDYASKHVDLIQLAVVTDNAPALALYRAMGFKTYGTEPRALKIGTRYISETLMQCDLN